MDKMKIRGVQFSSGRICHYFQVSNDELLITIDCDLGNLIVTEKELLSYLQSRNSLKGNIESPNSAEVKPEAESAASREHNTESFQLLCDLFLEVISACENKFVIDTKSYKRKINELRSATKNIS